MPRKKGKFRKISNKERKCGLKNKVKTSSIYSGQDEDQYSEEVIVKTIPVIRDLQLNPKCEHGPTVLFNRDGNHFFACSAYRNKKLCNFYMTLDRWESDYSPSNKRQKTDKSFNQQHVQSELIPETPLDCPLQQNQGEAQYHFSEPCVDFLVQLFQNLKLNNVLCIGVPSIHEKICHQQNMKSFLLDIDQRIIKHFKENCAQYNMCNHYFFYSDLSYREFLENVDTLTVVVDPPFGVKSELIWNYCLKIVQSEFLGLKGNNASCELFWIFPYFNEGHVLNACSDLAGASKFNMSDYKICYRNHKKISRNPDKSPVRMFTTVNLSKIALPQDEYRYCEDCFKWVALQNLHCYQCNMCTTRDGGKTYTHCDKCKRCVKPTWVHCSVCRKCHFPNRNCTRVKKT